MNLHKVCAMFALLVIVVGCASSQQPRDKSFALANEAYQLYWGTDWKAVVELTTEAIAADPDFPWPYSMRGAAYKNLGQYKLSLVDLNKALALSPDFSPAYTNRALTYIKLGDFKKAEADLVEALLLNPKDINTMLAMAEVRSATGKPDVSCALLLKLADQGFNDRDAIEMNPNFNNVVADPCYDRVMKVMSERRNSQPGKR